MNSTSLSSSQRKSGFGYPSIWRAMIGYGFEKRECAIDGNSA
jgi:hypothetical protein